MSQIKAGGLEKGMFILEKDIPYLVVPCYFLGKLLKSESPMMYSCITIAGAYNSKNYFEEGRNLEKMGINGMDKETLKKYLYYGEK